jgi:hypothetical protein
VEYSIGSLKSRIEPGTADVEGTSAKPFIKGLEVWVGIVNQKLC